MTRLPRLLNDLVNEGSQFIIATDSPMIITYPNSRTYVLGGDRIVETPYDQTDHYRVARDFLNHPKRASGTLFDQNEP